MIPTINLLCSDKNETAAKLRKACIETGFFYLENHGIPLSFLDEVFEQTKNLFDLPLNEKLKLHDKITNRGYTAFEEEALDIANQAGFKRGDTKEGFYVGAHIPPDNEQYNPKKFRGPNLYPNDCLTDHIKFRTIIDSYFDQISKVGFQVVRLLAQALHLKDDYFDEYFETNPIALLRLLHYSDEKSDPDKGIFSCGAHSDYGMITLLLVDSTPGLQIFKKPENEWVAVPPKRGAFIVNLGDMLERWTNGLFKSTVHRVISDGKHERYSIPFFYEPNYDTVIECLDVCWDEENTKKYKSITMGEFLISKYNETYDDFERKGIETEH